MKAIVIGGSLSGLFAGVVLRAQGWDVEIYERSSHTLESRGGGIVVQPEVVRLFEQVGLDPQGPVGIWARERIFLGDDGSVRTRIPLEQKQTSWNAIYRHLRRHFPTEAYFRGANLTEIHPLEERVRVRFEDGRLAEGDLLIGADGAGSAVRSLAFPSVHCEYSGYVAWRGLVPESDVPPEAAELLADRFAFYELPDSHVLCYLVAAEDLSVDPGRRRFNWVWYRPAHEVTDLSRLLTDVSGRRRRVSVPPGELSRTVHEAFQQDANNELCAPLRSLVAVTRHPFVHAIVDLSVRHMVQGRIALIGEAAFVARPHTAASTSKAATNVLALAEALAAEPDVPAALRRWEPTQLHLGESLIAYGRRLWDRTIHEQPVHVA